MAAKPRESMNPNDGTKSVKSTRAGLFNGPFILVFLANFCFFASSASLNMLPPYLEKLGASKAWIGLFQNIGALAVVLAVVLASPLLSSLPKKRSLIIANAISATALLAMFFVPGNLSALLILRLLTGFSFICGFTMNANIAFSLIPRQSRAGGIAIFGISGVLSNPVGSFIGERLVHVFPYSSLFLLGAFFALSAVVITLFFPASADTHSKKSTPHYLAVLSRKEVWPILFGGFVVGGAFSTHATFLPSLSIQRLGFSNLSLYFAAFAATAITIRILGAGLFAPGREKKLVTLALGFVAAAYAQTLSLTLPFQLVISGVLYGIGHSILYPVLSTSLVHSGPESERDTLNNAYIGTYTIGSVGLASLFGGLGDITRNTPVIFIAMGLTALAGLFWMALAGPLPVYKDTAVHVPKK